MYTYRSNSKHCTTSTCLLGLKEVIVGDASLVQYLQWYITWCCYGTRQVLRKSSGVVSCRRSCVGELHVHVVQFRLATSLYFAAGSSLNPKKRRWVEWVGETCIRMHPAFEPRMHCTFGHRVTVLRSEKEVAQASRNCRVQLILGRWRKWQGMERSGQCLVTSK